MFSNLARRSGTSQPGRRAFDLIDEDGVALRTSAGVIKGRAMNRGLRWPHALSAAWLMGMLLLLAACRPDRVDLAERRQKETRSGTLGRDSEHLAPLRPNIVWYVIDALRPDHLETYGYHRSTAPTIDRLASKGVLFTRCVAPGTWSLPSVTSMLSGAGPLSHGVCHAMTETVPEEMPLVAEALRAVGYATGSISENPHAPPKSGLGRGFDTAERSYLNLPARGRRRFAKSAALSDITFNAASKFVRENSDQPFFLFLHTVEPHEPYASPAKFRRFRAAGSPENARVDSYDDCIRWADANLNRFLSMLKEANVYDNTLVIVCADHGEGFTAEEGGNGHSGKPYFARVHVPLIFHWPGRVAPGQIINATVQLLDVSATVLDVAGLAKPVTFEGISMKPLLAGQECDVLRQRGILAIGHDPSQTAWIQGDRRLLAADGTQTLFDLAGHPHAPLPPTPAVADETARLAALREAYASRYTAAGAMADVKSTGETVVLDAVETEQLEALGYVR